MIEVCNKESEIRKVERAKPTVEVVVGLQWGDEGKGKISHIFSGHSKYVVRSTGGNNAGHTVVVDGEKYAMHLLPSSIIREDVVSIIGPGVVIDPEVFNKEVETMREKGISVTGANLKVSNRAHIIFPYTKDMDAYHELLKSKKIGTTKRGIGPAYADKVNRVGIRVCDLFLPEDVLAVKLEEAVKVPNMLFKEYRDRMNFLAPLRLAKRFLKKPVEEDLGFYPYTTEELLKICRKYKEYLGEFRSDVQSILHRAIKNEQGIVIEGAQAHSLDLDHGDYPYVTSSNPNASGSLSGAGIGPLSTKAVYGVCKAYCSRVGEGPFTTEQNNEVGDLIRELGHEYGTTTGRPRRCGWLDLVHLREAVQTSSVSSVTINHMDTIGKVGLQNPDGILLCKGYLYKGAIIQYVPSDIERAQPIYIQFKGWEIPDGAKKYEDLPKEARDYLEYIEAYLEVPIEFIGIGPNDTDLIHHEFQVI